MPACRPREGKNDLYRDVVPDTTLLATEASWMTYSMDVNGDHITDFDLHARPIHPPPPVPIISSSGYFRHQTLCMAGSR
jgi:hypothetical protein